MAKILLADNQEILRQGLRSVLNCSDSWEIIAEAHDARSATDLAEQHQPDLVIMELDLPSIPSTEMIGQLTKLKNPPGILIFSANDSGKKIKQAIDAGANGFLSKNSSIDELRFALQSILQGKSYLSPEICEVVLREKQNSEESPFSYLTKREYEIAKMICSGIPNKTIAKDLHISIKTVDTHRANILKKLELANNAALVEMAVRTGLI
jgi:DNA-binding NarL/FixJ family response regulator